MIELWTHHYAGTYRQPAFTMMIEQMGAEGYGIYWILTEILLEQPEHRYPLSLVPSIAKQINSTSAKIETVINAYGQFEIDDNSFFFSPTLLKVLEPFLETRRGYSLKGKKSALSKKQKNDALEKELQEYLSQQDSNQQKQKQVELSKKNSNQQKRKDKTTIEKSSLDLKSVNNTLSYSEFLKKLRRRYEGRVLPIQGRVLDYLPETMFRIQYELVWKIVGGKESELIPDDAKEVLKALYNEHIYLLEN